MGAGIVPKVRDTGIYEEIIRDTNGEASSEQAKR
jgi:hypothetical protein